MEGSLMIKIMCINTVTNHKLLLHSEKLIWQINAHFVCLIVIHYNQCKLKSH